MKLISKIVVGIVFCSMTMPLVAQQMEAPKSLLSPNVATLGSFREPEVALYTGTPSISIPLFEIPLQDFVLPVELQYNGTSILVDQPPSWVGLGWNLSAGGVITRKVNDIEDDHRFTAECYESLSTGYWNDGYYYREHTLANDDWYDMHVTVIGVPNQVYPYYPVYADTEPDEFSFSFPGYSGKFYLNHHQKWEVQCDKSVSVQLIPTTMYPPFSIPSTKLLGKCKKQPDCFAGFIITIEDGTQYVFGNDVNAIDFCTEFFTYEQIMAANAWHLTKIILPSKQEITFTYQRQAFTNQMYQALITSKNELNEGNAFWGASCDWSVGNYLSWEHIRGKLLSPVYLQSIQSPTLTLNFYNSVANDLQYRDSVYAIVLNHLPNYYMPYVTKFTPYEGDGSATPHYLDSIHSSIKRYKLDSIVASTATSHKKISFNYLESSSVRLSLRDIIMNDNSGYHFDYNDESGLPHYLSFKSDHWGYYNNTSSVINNANDTLYYYSKRQPDSFYAKKGLLSRICYPTGAVTKLEYESNDYQQQVAEKRWDPLISYASKQYGGGVRIRKILYYQSENDEQPTSFKEYFYKANYLSNPNSQQSSGILGERFKYRYSYVDSLFTEGTISRKFFSSVSVLPNMGQKPSVCYSDVTEKLSSGGYNRYRFVNFSNILDESPIRSLQSTQIAYGKYTSNSNNRGLLLSKEEYDNSKNLRRRTNYTYIPNKSIESYVRSVNWQMFQDCQEEIQRWINEGFSYKIYTHTMVPDTIREVDFSTSGDSLVKTIINTYDTLHQMLIKKEVFTPTDTISKHYRYPFDLIAPSALNGPFANEQEEVCAGMVNNHIYLPWEVVSKKGNKVTGSTCFHYSKYTTTSQNTFYAVDSISFLGLDAPISSFQHITLSQRDNHYITPAKQSCKYDAFGNIIEIVTDGIPTSYIWGYAHSYVVVKVIGVSYSQLEQVIPQRYFGLLNIITGPTLVSLDNIRSMIYSAYPYSLCTTYQYNAFYGITSETDPSGHTVFYEYDSMGRLQEAYYRENNAKRILKKYRYNLKTFTPTPQPGIL